MLGSLQLNAITPLSADELEEINVEVDRDVTDNSIIGCAFVSLTYPTSGNTSVINVENILNQSMFQSATLTRVKHISVNINVNWSAGTATLPVSNALILTSGSYKYYIVPARLKGQGFSAISGQAANATVTSNSIEFEPLVVAKYNNNSYVGLGIDATFSLTLRRENARQEYTEVDINPNTGNWLYMEVDHWVPLYIEQNSGELTICNLYEYGVVCTFNLGGKTARNTFTVPIHQTFTEDSEGPFWLCPASYTNVGQFSMPANPVFYVNRELNGIANASSMTWGYCALAADEEAWANDLWHGQALYVTNKITCKNGFTLDLDFDQPTTLRGDFNNDNEVNVTDIGVLVNAIFSDSTDHIYDLNNDNGINVTDIAVLINIILEAD